MTLEEFETAKISNVRHDIKVLHHKTNEKYGYANVIVDVNFYKILKFYGDHLRAYIMFNNNPEHGHIFCGHDRK